MFKLLAVFAASLVLAYISEQNTKATIAAGYRYSVWSGRGTQNYLARLRSALIENNVEHRRECDILFPKGKTNEDKFWSFQVFGNAKKLPRFPMCSISIFIAPESWGKPAL